MKKKLMLSVLSVAVLIGVFSAGVWAASGMTLIVNGKVSTADVQVINDSSYVPLRAVAEMLGADVGYENSTKTITITAKGSAAVETDVEETVEGTYKAEGLTFYDLTAVDGTYGWEVNVDLRNDGDKDIDGVVFTAAFYGEDGKRIGTAQGSAQSLVQGDSKTTKLITSDDLTGYTSVKFQVDMSY